ncbi:mechanosensitive ion channel family protein [Algivirga pacifica]|uniref:Small conductance mechanosensitive channel n=1 Tax=Algivirga pacifica TaxID=1162670 RepID=A0ABP9D1S0_9BACT
MEFISTLKGVFKAEVIANFLEKIQNWVITDLPVIVLMTIGIFIALRFINFFVERLKGVFLKNTYKQHSTAEAEESEKRINTLTNIIHGVIKIILVSTYLMMMLQRFGVDITPILTSAGIVGLAVGFGAKELVRDMISGFFILLENQVRTGDVAIINGTGGLVEKIELRTITMRDFSGVVHVFQNGKINTLANMTKDWSAMVFDIGVAYKEDVSQVMEIMREIGEELRNDTEFGPKILEPIEIFGLDKFADSALVIKARLKTKPIMQWEVGREYRKRLKVAFDEHNIEIPFPHTTVYWGEKTSPLELQINQARQEVTS